MLRLVLLTLIILAIESALTSLPLLLIIVGVLAVLYKETWVAALAFFGGLLLDVTKLQPLGSTSLFLVCWLFLILLYERKYEVDSIPFVAISSFFGTLLYMWIFEGSGLLMHAGAASVLATLLYLGSRVIRFRKRAKIGVSV